MIMSYLSLLITLIGGIGIVSIVQVVIANSARKKELFENRTYKEMRNSYIGLLNSLHNAAVNHSDKSSKEYALWQTQINCSDHKKYLSMFKISLTLIMVLNKEMLPSTQ